MTPVFKHKLKTVLLTILFFIIFAAVPIKYNSAFAVDLTSSPFTDCWIIPANPKENQNIKLHMEFDTAAEIGGIRIDITSYNSQNDVPPPQVDLTKNAGTQTLEVPLGRITNAGDYSFIASLPVSGCARDFAVAAGETGTNAVLIEPAREVRTDNPTLPSLKIGGLIIHHKYRIELSGAWNGSLLSHPDPDSDVWEAGGGGSPFNDFGVITARNICNNGESNRGSPCGSPFNDGDYIMKIFDRNNNPSQQITGSPLMFRVRSAGRDLIITTDPPSPISTQITTIKTLTISAIKGALSGTYTIDLVQDENSHWAGGNLGNSGNSNGNEWVANSDGKIVANNICDNGEANRPEDGDHPCEHAFESGTYKMIVRKADKVVDELSFEVSERLGEPGKNPCETQPGSAEIQCETALGIIPTNPKAFAEKVLAIALGLAGGIALIFMVIGSIKVLTSSGDQQKLNAGRDQIVAAVAGLLFLIFSVLILRFIGIELFGLFT